MKRVTDIVAPEIGHWVRVKTRSGQNITVQVKKWVADTTFLCEDLAGSKYTLVFPKDTITWINPNPPRGEFEAHVAAQAKRREEAVAKAREPKSGVDWGAVVAIGVSAFFAIMLSVALTTGLQP